ncbi:MAG: DUF1559 domain-containing protein [Planctomycetaceae bacterium]|jgi:hypothetical protein|nr:DUF1559 domain-containing protein [Planctomycetaceae bacterium]
MRTFFLTILFVFSISISGCSDKSNQQVKVLPGADGGLQSPAESTQSKVNSDNASDIASSGEFKKPPVSPPTSEMLLSLGEKQNNLDTRWFFPDSYYILTGQPKKFFETEIGKNSENVLSSIFNTIFQLQFPIDYGKVERFTLVAAPQGEIVFDVKTPDGSTTPRHSLAFRRVTIFNLNEPIAENMIQTLWKSLSNKPLESIKTRIANIEYYNLLPSDIQIDKIKGGIFLPDKSTIVIFIMMTEDANAIFAEKPKINNPAIERIKRLDIDSNLLTLSASWEDVKADPIRIQEIPFVGVILSSLGNDNAMKFIQNFRAINLAIKPDSQVGKPMLSARYDAVDNNGAAKLYETFLGLHITAQTTFKAIKDESSLAAWGMSKDTIKNILGSIELEKSNDTGFYFRINKFDGFDEILKKGIADMSTQMQKNQTLTRKVEQLKNLADISIQYDRLNKKFPQPIRDANGKPLLSWRVAILPLIGQQELYNKFNLKETWDSPTNLPLLENIPAAFTPVDNNIDKGKTQIQRFASTGTPLADTELTIAKVKNPTTLLIVQTSAEKAIEWTKPDELTYDENNIEKIFDDLIIGINFSGAHVVQNLLPSSNPQSKFQREMLSSIIKDEKPPTINHETHNHDHGDHDHSDHDNDHGDHDHPSVQPTAPPSPVALPVIPPQN